MTSDRPLDPPLPSEHHPNGSPASERRVALVEPSGVLREALLTLVAGARELVIESPAASFDELDGDGHAPDVVVCHLDPDDADVVAELVRFRARFPGCGLVAVLDRDQANQADAVLDAGAQAVLASDSAAFEWAVAIGAAARGARYVSGRLAGQDGEDPLARLTAREREVLQLLARGYTNRQVGEKLAISVRTVETHRQHLTAKLRARSRSDLVRSAIRGGLIDDQMP